MRRVETYERKYGVLSETFYESYRRGEEPADDAWVMDWSAWAGAYEVWRRRRSQYMCHLTSSTIGFQRRGCGLMVRICHC